MAGPQSPVEAEPPRAELPARPARKRRSRKK
jgi:hypothetical protein